MTMKSEMRGIWLVTAAALLWSTGGLGIKAIEDPALKVAFFRSAIGGITLFLLFRPRKINWNLPFVAAVGSYAACVTLFVLATKLTTAANAIFLQYSGIVWVLIGSPLILRETLRRRDMIASVIAMGGMALFFVGRFEGGSFAGNTMALLAGLFFAILVMSLRMVRGTVAEAAVCWGNVVAAVALFPFVAHDLRLTMTSGIILAFLGIFQIALAYWCLVKGLEHVTASAAFLTGMIEPVANPVWVFLVVGERPSPFAIIGGVIVLGAIGWRTLAVGPPSKKAIAPPD